MVPADGSDFEWWDSAKWSDRKRFARHQLVKVAQQNVPPKTLSSNCVYCTTTAAVTALINYAGVVVVLLFRGAYTTRTHICNIIIAVLHYYRARLTVFRWLSTNQNSTLNIHTRVWTADWRKRRSCGARINPTALCILYVHMRVLLLCQLYSCIIFSNRINTWLMCCYSICWKSILHF